MARRKKRRKKVDQDQLLIKAVLAILLLVLSIITTLSFFENAGTVGIVLNEYILSFLFGQSRFIAPIVFVVLAWYLLADIRYEYRPTHGIGAVLLFLAVSSFLHMEFALETMWAEAINGRGGGVFGMFAWPLVRYFGDVAAWVVLGAMTLIGIILLFNTSLLHLLSLHQRLRDGLIRLGEWWDEKIMGSRAYDEDEDDDENEEEYEEDEYEEEEEEEFEDDDEYDDEEEIEEETSSKKKGKKPLFERRSLKEEEDDLNDEEELDDEETPSPRLRNTREETIAEKPQKKAVQSQQQTHTIAPLDEVPFWQKHAIIRKPPAVELLQHRSSKPTTGNLEENKQLIEETLAEFNIDVTMDDVRVGPTVTQYTFRPARGVKIARITSLSNDLALALAAHPIRIEAPIPGKSLVGIEVPNNSTAMVSLRELIESKQFKKRKHNLMIGLGKDVGGKVWFADLPRMPHLLIAGSTGSGKTVCMNTIITSLLYQNTAKTLRMIMVDPKRVELTLYNGIPHLLTPVITSVPDTVNALKWTIGEMDRRFELLAKAGNRDINTYNAAHKKEPIPHLVFIIDELADLMITASQDVETGIIRLAQMARAVGIHLILATQRPSVDVITGLMKANIPGRIAFSVASITDSRTILDAAGAEKLIGKGDMLLQTADLGKPVRIQGAFMSEDESKTIIDYLKGNDKPVYDESILNPNNGAQLNLFGAPANDDRDELFNEAKDLVIRSNKASASMLQRRLKVGYARAARILDELEEAGIIGPSNGSKPRDILMTEEDVETSMNLGGAVFGNAPAENNDEKEEELEDVKTQHTASPQDEDFEDEAFEDEEDEEDELDETDDEEYEEEEDLEDEAFENEDEEDDGEELENDDTELEDEELEEEDEYEDDDETDETDDEEEEEDLEEEELEEDTDQEYDEDEDEDEDFDDKEDDDEPQSRSDGKGNTFFY